MMFGVIFSIIFGIILFYLNRNWQPRVPIFISKNKILRIGHRGVPVNEHENTLKSFKLAIKSNLDGIELDVQLTSDKELIVYHDWTCINNLGFEVDIEKTDHFTLQNIKLTNKPETNMPLLSDVLSILPNKYIKIIEIKSKHIKNTGIEKKIITILEKYQVINSCIISSFNPFIIRRINRLNSNIQTAFLWTMDEPVFLINTPLWVWWCRPDGFHADINYLNQNLVNWVRKNQMSIFGFTVRSEEQYKRAIDLDLDGIFIDDPKLNYNIKPLKK
tara:strand:+ start:2406 stop:3227 length:822 start_codon:yes stop_codon:yes gene_type:complete